MTRIEELKADAINASNYSGPRIVRAKVLEPVIIDSVPQEVGALIEVDEITFTNLKRKGRLGEA